MTSHEVMGVMLDAHRHMDAEEAERYLMGTSPDREAANLEEHLLVCAPCRASISHTDIYLSAMSDAALQFRRPMVSSARYGRQLAIVIAAVLLLLGALALRR